MCLPILRATTWGCPYSETTIGCFKLNAGRRSRSERDGLLKVNLLAKQGANGLKRAMAHDLVFENVDKCKAQNDCATVFVFTKLNLTVAEGEHLAIVGGSGVGKTTLLRLANRLEEPDTGQVRFGGTPVLDIEPTQHRRDVAMVLQKPCLFSQKVVENVYFPDTLRKLDPDEEKAKELLRFVGIEDELFSRDGESLSIGQQQRVCLARALYCDPKILMMDETTSSFDPNLAERVLDNLFALSKERSMTILHVTHEMRKIRLADRVVLLDNGGVAEEGKPQELLENPKTEAGRRFIGK